jgi:hypothetical protein
MTVGFVMDRLGGAARRNAPPEPEPFYQAKLREQVRALVKAYGWRQDYEGPNRRVVPYLPRPFAEAMFEYARRQAEHWLGKSIPDPAKQPNFIRNRVREAETIIGDEKSYEAAPSVVATKAPAYYKADVPAGRPSAVVLSGERTYWFLYRMEQLAIHFDALSGTPTKVDIFVEALGESVEELPGRVVEATKATAGAGKELLTTVAVIGVGLLALFLVTR